MRGTWSRGGRPRHTARQVRCLVRWRGDPPKCESAGGAACARRDPAQHPPTSHDVEHHEQEAEKNERQADPALRLRSKGIQVRG